MPSNNRVMIFRFSKFLFGFLLFLTAIFIGCADRSNPNAPDAIFYNGVIYTLDSNQPKIEAFAVKGQQIVFAGDLSAALQPKDGKTRMVDLHGATVMPGLIDAHGHMSALGKEEERVSLTGTGSYGEVVERTLAASQAKRNGWLIGRGWDQNDWGSGLTSAPGELFPFPTHAMLSDAISDRPVWLVRIDGHAGLANAKAMALSGVTRDTPDPSGGKIVRDESGEPTGVFVDTAMNLISTQLPEPSDEDIERWILSAADRCLHLGLTSVHDAGIDMQTLNVYRKLADEKRLPIRIYAMKDFEMPEEELLAPPIINEGDGFLTVRAIKVYCDGALGSRGAALLQHYSDDHGTRGLMQITHEKLEDLCLKAVAAGYQVCTHAIGDRANRLVLDVYEHVLKDYDDPRDFRFRVEHAQVLHPHDIPRFARWSIVASMQPIHATSDMPWAERRLGPSRILGAYAWRELYHQWAVLAFGSDFPVESPNPFWGIYAAETRQDAEGQPSGGWFPEQSLTREYAILSYTRDAAYAAFEDEYKGKIAPGYLADFLVLDRELLTTPPRVFRDMKVLETYVGGQRYTGQP